MLTKWTKLFGDTLTKPALSLANAKDLKMAKLVVGFGFMLHCIVQPSNDLLGQFF
jgi:hypothetical protein